MTIIDAHGITHRGAGTAGAGQFAGRTHSAPANNLAVPDPPRAVGFLTRAGREAAPVAADNSWMLAEFEENHPEPVLADYRDFLNNVPAEFHDNGDPDYGSDERRGAVRAISSRLADGQSGMLVEADALEVGDRIDLSRIWSDDDYPGRISDWGQANFGVVTDSGETGDGSTIVTLSNFDHPVVVPTGTLIPVQSVTFHGTLHTERQLVHALLQTGELSPAARGMLPREVLDQYIEANALTEGDHDYPGVLL